MGGTMKKVGKAALAGVAVTLAVQHLSSKLPEKLKAGGTDLRPYIVGTAAVMVLFALPGGAAPVKAA